MDNQDLSKLIKSVGTLVTTAAVFVFNVLASKKS